MPVGHNDLLYRRLTVFQYLGKVSDVLSISTFTGIHQNTSNMDNTAQPLFQSFHKQKLLITDNRDG